MDRICLLSSALSTFSQAKSSDAIDMDDLHVVSWFASREIEGKSAFVPRILGHSFNHSGEMLRLFGRLAKSRMKDFDVSDTMKYISTSLEVVNTLRTNEHFSHLDDAKLAVLQWCTCAYALTMDPSSRADIRVNFNKTEFLLIARTAIQAGQNVDEYLGMMPGDGNLVSEFASVTVSSEQNQPVGEARTLYGPLRMAQHRCKSNNAELVPVKGTSAFVLRTKRDVAPGEEITVNYGLRKEDCTCMDCKQKAMESLGDAWQAPADAEDIPASHPPALLAALQSRHALIEAIEGPIRRENMRKQKKEKLKAWKKRKTMEYRLAKEKAKLVVIEGRGRVTYDSRPPKGCPKMEGEHEEGEIIAPKPTKRKANHFQPEDGELLTLEL